MDFASSSTKQHTRRHGSTIILFDVDGTLAVPAQRADDKMIQLLEKLSHDYAVGIVGAGNFDRQQVQLGRPDMKEQLDFCFSENGIHAFRGAEEIHRRSIADHVGDRRWQRFRMGVTEILDAERPEADRLLRLVNPGLRVDERSNFIEQRQCTVNICPIGRDPDLTKEERAVFDMVEKEAGFRQRIVGQLAERFGPGTEHDFMFTIGGQIGIDVCPNGWDKTFCLQFLPDDKFTTLHFFGDKTQKGGGDYEIYNHPRTIGHTVTSPEDTMDQIERLFLCPSNESRL